jgi:hypothetical protein
MMASTVLDGFNGSGSALTVRVVSAAAAAAIEKAAET